MSQHTHAHTPTLKSGGPVTRFMSTTPAVSAEKSGPHGNAPATWARMKSLGYFLTQRGIEALYLVNDNCGRQSEFVQIEVNVETEYVDRPLYFHHWNSPRDLRDLVDDNGGSQFTGEDRTVFEPPTYKLEQILDVAAYMQLAQAEHAQQRQAIARRAYKLTEGGGESKVISHAELDPGFEKFPWWNGQRMFDDWTISSAGRSGVRLCDHWVLDASDYTDPRGVRTMSFVPLWTLGYPLWSHRGHGGGGPSASTTLPVMVVLVIV